MKSPPLIALAAVGLVLAGCAGSQPRSVSSLSEDDDTFCRANNVQPGSAEYIACRKDRDVQRSNTTTRADRRQRELGEYMLNHPDHP
jgi:hypothetical protein